MRFIPLFVTDKKLKIHSKLKNRNVFINIYYNWMICAHKLFLNSNIFKDENSTINNGRAKRFFSV